MFPNLNGLRTHMTLFFVYTCLMHILYFFLFLSNLKLTKRYRLQLSYSLPLKWKSCKDINLGCWNSNES